MTEFLDRPEHQDFLATIRGRQVALKLGNTGIALFRMREDVDYLDYHTTDEDGDEQHTLIFNHRELAIWMGGVAIHPADDRMLRLANRENGSFRTNFGWNPPVFIEDYPSEHEIDMYITATTQDLDDADPIALIKKLDQDND